jgi:hypothetical protein|tara:strand:- start:70 stop:726 length:657 start_codon:yes stop_codon:yes gene_type:complete
MDPQDIVLEVSKNVDDIRYADTKKTWTVSDRITIGWEKVLPLPPANTSETTIKELRYLSKLTSNITSRQRGLVKLVDKEPLDLLKPILKKNNLIFDRSQFKKLWNIVRPVIMNLKWQYNRPRPVQLSPLFGLKIDETESKTTHTPAYPSGHTVYTAMGAYLLAASYPTHTPSFFYCASLAGYARCLMGVHYPSDNAASMVIAGALWEDVKYRMFPELF